MRALHTKIWQFSFYGGGETRRRLCPLTAAGPLPDPGEETLALDPWAITVRHVKRPQPLNREPMRAAPLQG
jgi:hypothetical protein